MKVHEIIKLKGTDVHTVTPDATIADVVQRLVNFNCGSLLVMSDNHVDGIITERDILRTCANESRPLEQIQVRERMTVEIVTGSPEDDVNDIMGLLTEHRIRHLPIVDDGRLYGIISIGDVVKAQHDLLSMENHYLKNYLQS